MSVRRPAIASFASSICCSEKLDSGALASCFVCTLSRLNSSSPIADLRSSVSLSPLPPVGPALPPHQIVDRALERTHAPIALRDAFGCSADVADNVGNANFVLVPGFWHGHPLDQAPRRATGANAIDA